MSDDNSPDRQAYREALEQGLHGRFAANIANIRLFKDNPYIADLPEADRIELNKKLLAPFNGEQFYDDDKFVYVCNIVKDPVSNEQRFVYTSKEKEIYEKLKYYETKGVMNQLLSAYQNGKVYRFYYNKTSLTMFPNADLVFPENYNSYTIRLQGLNSAEQFVYVAGQLNDGQISDVHIQMKVIEDVAKGTRYRRMGPAEIFATSNPDNQYATIQNGFFYAVDFFDEQGQIIETKLFQAVEAISYDTQVPSATIVDLKITVFKNNTELKSSTNTYSIYAGEDLQATTALAVSAVYSDGTQKVITDKQNNGLSIEGLDHNTTGMPEGSIVPVTVTYNPNVNSAYETIGQAITKEIYFQVVSNSYTAIKQVIPVVWKDNSSDFIIDSTIGAVIYKLKVYGMSSTGVLENKTRSFYDSMKVVVQEQLDDFADCPVAYDPYQQCCTFAFPAFSDTGQRTFEFGMYTNGKFEKYRFNVTFGLTQQDFADRHGEIVGPWVTTGEKYGYKVGDVFKSGECTLANTYNNDTAVYNKATITGSMGVASMINIKTSTPGTRLASRYSRLYDDGKSYDAGAIQLFSVKDKTCTPLTPIYTFNSGVTEVNVPIIDDDGVRTIVKNLSTHDYILAKYYYIDAVSGNSKMNHFDVYSVFVTNM